MGGIGSGRHRQFGTSGTTDDYRSIDIRWLRREGMLSPGRSSRITWSRGDEVVASIGIKAEPGCVVLSYRHQSGGGDWQDESYPVHVINTPCYLGGERHWLLCPARGCGRRVAILYGGAIFACRHCYRLAYPSQREQSHDQATRRADSIRKRLGWEPGILNGRGPKPKGMHWETFERLVAEHDALAQVCLDGIIQKFGLFSRGPLR